MSSLKGVELMLDEWVRAWRKNEEGGVSWFKAGKSRYLMVILICLGLLAILWPVTKSDVKTTTSDAQQAQSLTGGAGSRMAADLEKILSKVEGAGKVDVSISLASEGSKTYASNTRSEKNTIEERDPKGSSKTTSQENISHDLAVSAGSPLLLEDKTPEVLGVLVVADGATDATVRERLLNATATLLNVTTHKVLVMPREGGQ
ncbi:MAG TPA: hypothetical protein VN426_03620 [Syntrophomonadaceae bacterium]|nr:hypothetical protein [Syntrophomonadaceae bacterium]